MSKAIGIRQNKINVVISGARVSFDPRTTERVETSRDPKNYKSLEKAWRTALWQRREEEKRVAAIGEVA